MARRHSRTSSSRPDFATAYRAAGRVREAETAERIASASSPPEGGSLLKPELLEVCRQLKAAQDHARSLGIFVDDRDLLTCEKCGLQEDVLITGVLVTHQVGDDDARDTGLRFKEIASNLFKCPRCGNEVVLTEAPLNLDDDFSGGPP